jgi:hypothetical protein
MVYGFSMRNLAIVVGLLLVGCQGCGGSKKQAAKPAAAAPAPAAAAPAAEPAPEPTETAAPAPAAAPAKTRAPAPKGKTGGDPDEGGQ